MIEMKVMGIALDTRTGSPIVVLHDMENRKALPIWIGSAEASAIIGKTGYKLDRVEIADVENETYFANLVLVDSDGNEVEVDSRPSDAIAAAIRIDVPIFISPKVLANGAVSINSEKDEEETREFKDFVQNIKPSDFEKMLKDFPQSDQ